MKHFLLFYETSPDYLERRPTFRGAHLGAARASIARGELQLGGAFNNPVDGALLLFKGESAAVAEEFAKGDPYVLNGLIKRWWVREWTTVVGEGAAQPLPP